MALGVQFDVIKLFFGLKGPAGGRLDAALFLHRRLASGQLVFHRHHATAEPFPLLLLPARPADPQFFQQARAQLLELLFGPFVHDDPVGTAADDLLDREFPSAQHALAEQRHPQGTDHQGGQFAGFDVEAEPQHPPQLIACFGDHLAVDHLAVTVRIKGLGEGIDRIHQDHVAHLADPIQGHPAGQTGQKTGQGVVAQPQGHHLAPVDIHHHLAYDPQPPAGVAGDHLGAHQLGAQPEAITGGSG